MTFDDITKTFLEEVAELSDFLATDYEFTRPDIREETIRSGEMLGNVIPQFLSSMHPNSNRDELLVAKVASILEGLLTDANVNVRDQVSLYFGEAILDSPTLLSRLESHFGPLLKLDLQRMKLGLERPW